MDDILSVLHSTHTSATDRRHDLGRLGEKLAAEYLIAQGFRLILSNFKVPIGRNTRGVAVTGEIDIVALDGETICFVEVKTRVSDEFAEPIANVTARKQRQIIRTARVYRRIFGLTEMTHRYDVVSVVLERGSEPRFELAKGFWSERKFRKKAWSGDFY